MSEHQQTQQSKKPESSSQKQITPLSQTPVSNPASIIQRARIDPKSLTHADVMQLQQTIGNRAVGRLLSSIRNPSKVQKMPIQRQKLEEEETCPSCVQRQEIPEEEEPIQGKFESKLEARKTCSNSCKQNVGFNSSGPTADMILQLQRTAGNQAVQRLIKSRALQAKLRIGQPNDVYEQEADRVAEQVMRMPEPQVSNETKAPKKATANLVQLKCPECRLEEEEEKKTLQAKEISGSTPKVTPELESRISAIRGGGQLLPDSTRAFFEPRFGHDFSGVRVHSGAAAVQSARDVNARAYTVGSDIVFGAGQLTPGTHEGRRLIAHELTHVVQQSQGGLPPVAPRVTHEADAARAPEASVSGGTLVQISAATGVELTRDEDPEVEKALGGLKEQEVPSGQPAKPAAQDALTTDELIDEHVFGPRIHEEVGDLRKRLANQEARLKVNPKDKALQAKVTEMRARLRVLEGRGLDPSARGANVPGVGSINTRAAIQVIGPDGKIIAIERGSWGPTHHAEGDALAKLRSRLGTQKLPEGTHIMIAGNQVVCGKVCKPDIARFAKDYGVPLENVNASVRTRPKMVGQGQASSKTTEFTGLRGDVPKATVKTEPLFHGDKEPAAPAKLPLEGAPSAEGYKKVVSNQPPSPEEPIVQKPSPTEFKVNTQYRVLNVDQIPGGRVVSEVEVVFSEGLEQTNQAVKVHGGKPFPSRLILHITTDSNGALVAAEMTSGEAAGLAETLARQALSSAPRGATGAEAGAVAASRGVSPWVRGIGWAGMALFVVLTACRYSQASPEEKPKVLATAGGGLAGGMVTGYVACNLILGIETLGWSLLICGFVAGIPGGIAGEAIGETAYEATIDDDKIRDWVSANDLALIKRLPVSEKVRMILSLMKGWISDADIAAIERICLSVANRAEMVNIRREVEPHILDMTSIGQRTRVRVTLARNL